MDHRNLQRHALLVNQKLQWKNLLINDAPLQFTSLLPQDVEDTVEAARIRDERVLEVMSALLERIETESSLVQRLQEELRAKDRELTEQNSKGQEIERTLLKKERDLHEREVELKQLERVNSRLSIKKAALSKDIESLKLRNAALEKQHSVIVRRQNHELEEVKHLLALRKRIRLAKPPIGPVGGLPSEPTPNVELISVKLGQEEILSYVEHLKEVVELVTTDNYYYEYLVASILKFLESIMRRLDRKPLRDPATIISKGPQVDLTQMTRVIRPFEEVMDEVLLVAGALTTFLESWKQAPPPDSEQVAVLRKQLAGMSENFNDALATLEKWKRIAEMNQKRT